LACQEAQLKLSHIYDKIDASSLEDDEIGQEDLEPAEEHQETETTKPTTTVSAETQPNNTASDPIEIFVDAVDIDEAEEEEEEEEQQQQYDEEVEEPITDESAPPQLTISYACKFCLRPQESYQLQQLLLEHINASHDPERQFKCRHSGCERLFISQRHLMCHEATHSGTSSRKSEHCGFCGKSKNHQFSKNLRSKLNEINIAHTPC